MAIVIDQTHMGRRASGIERVTAALFSQAALAPLDVEVEHGRSNRLDMLFHQAVTMPAAAVLRPDTVWIFPGFPPSPAFAFLAQRTVVYVHDLFLMQRKHELNGAAKRWLAPNFARALSQGALFLANSETTAAELRPHVREEAEILLYRPPAADSFQLAGRRTQRPRPPAPIILGALGTLEPRKNFLAAARIAQALCARLQTPVELHIVGRPGWGGVHERLSREQGVVLHGFLPDAEARCVIERFDALVCTSHAEGLCLPLLELQFGGIPVFSPDQPVFREVLGDSGHFMDPGKPQSAAGVIANALASPHVKDRADSSAQSNISRWNALASSDRDAVVRRLAELSAKVART